MVRYKRDAPKEVVRDKRDAPEEVDLKTQLAKRLVE